MKQFDEKLSTISRRLDKLESAMDDLYGQATGQKIKEELKPCPFCGEIKDVNLFRDEKFKDSWRVICFKCTASGPADNLKQRAINKWNSAGPDLR